MPYLLVLAVSLVVTFAATPLVRRLSLRMGWVDNPSDRKVHPTPTPTVGGLAMLLGVLAGVLASRLLPVVGSVATTSGDLQAAVLAAVAIVALGLVDDVKGISAETKLVGQIFCAGLAVLLGVQLLFFYLPGQGIVSLDPTLAIPLTVLWMLVMVNAMNLIDGLDGLAAGIAAIAALAFLVYLRSGGASTAPSAAAVLAAIVAGTALGFLPWNFHPARIFMGDVGSMLLGLLLGIATVSGVGRNPYPPAGGDLAAIAIPIALPLLVLALPILDVLLAIARRVRRRRSLGHADKEHIHHRLLDIGHTHRRAVLLMYLWSALVSGCALAVAFLEGWRSVGLVVGLAVVVGTVVPWWLLRGVPRATEGEG
ncbi:MAG: glycosyltransferase family 4 protein [Actinomycetota bacterium]